MSQGALLWQCERNPLSDMQDDDDRKEEYGTWGDEKDRERERLQRRGRAGGGKGKVYMCHLCIKGVAVLARVHMARLRDCF